MRRLIRFECEGSVLSATLDHGTHSCGLLIVSGGNEIRIGAHRGMAQLARDIAARGHSVFRFDRRGIGDSEGDNLGFRRSGADVHAALECFRASCPAMTRVAAFGNCDAATALVMHDPALDGRVLANPWVIPPDGDLPPPAAIKDRYIKRLRDPDAWRALLSGQVDMRKLAKGLGRLAALRPPLPDSLADKIVRAIEASTVRTTIVLAAQDATALAFADVWRGDPSVPVIRIETASHSFAETADYQALLQVLADTLTN